MPSKHVLLAAIMIFKTRILNGHSGTSPHLRYWHLQCCPNKSKWKIVNTKVEKSIFCLLIEFSICCHIFCSPPLLYACLFGQLNKPWTLFKFTRTGALNNIPVICSLMNIIKKKKTHSTHYVSLQLSWPNRPLFLWSSQNGTLGFEVWM